MRHKFRNSKSCRNCLFICKKKTRRDVVLVVNFCFASLKAKDTNVLRSIQIKNTHVCKNKWLTNCTLECRAKINVSG